jgi:hypothetical protein
MIGKGALLFTFLLCGCGSPRADVVPAVEFTLLPPAGAGSPDKLGIIEGRVKFAKPGQRIVLFARSGIWWVQPTVADPFTAIKPDGSWRNQTHPGSAYAAVLVNPGYQPPTTMDALPEVGGVVVSVARVEGKALSRPPVRTLSFSGYEWQLRQASSDRGGTRNAYNPDNVWTDKDGLLHLRIVKTKDSWTSAEVGLTRSLGYGSYRFVVRDVTHLEPAIVFSIFTWDDAGPPREMDIEMGRWGETSSKNGQYVIQPYYVPANVMRFVAPFGTLTHALHWEPGRVSFKTVRGSGPELVAQHAFTSGVQSPGNELVYMNLYVYDNKTNPLRQGAEVIVEKFEYLP